MKTKMVWARHSISIAFLEVVFDESDGSVKSDTTAILFVFLTQVFDCLFLLSLS